MDSELTKQNQMGEKPLGEVVREAIDASTGFIVKEMHVLRAQVTEALQQGRNGALWLATGAVFAALGLFAIALSVIAALSLAIPVWAAALVTAFVFLAIGGIGVWVGVRALKTQAPAAVNRTTETVKEDVRWLKKHLS